MSQSSNDFERQDDLPADEEQERTMPLLGGGSSDLPEAADLEFQSIGDGSGKVFNHGTALVLIVAVIAGGAFYFMRASQGDLGPDEQTASAQARVEQALAQLSQPEQMPDDDPLRPDNLNKLVGDSASVIAMFTDDIASRQVPLEYVQKNPFVLYRPQEAQADPDDDDGPTAEELEAERRRKQAEAERRRIEREAGRLQLDGVMGNVAIISGETVREGASVGEFTVERITRDSIVLKAGDHRFELNMGGDLELLNQSPVRDR